MISEIFRKQKLGEKNYIQDYLELMTGKHERVTMTCYCHVKISCLLKIKVKITFTVQSAHSPIC